MKEELLHMVWKTKRFNLHNLKTTHNEVITILNFGFHNHNAGPDFLNAKIKISDTTWVGHIEMHTSASEWIRHKHHIDPAYNNVILHVVYNNDAIVKTKNHQTLPTLILKGRIENKIIDEYERLLLNSDWIPCAAQFAKINPFKLEVYLESMLVERLEEKCKVISNYLEYSKNDWEHVCFKLIIKYLGLKVNSEAFEMLSGKTPYSLLIKNNQSLAALESLLFGQAGLLLKTPDRYTQNLKKEYLYLQKKYKLSPMTGVEWRFARMRPSNFPSIRIAQLAALYFKTSKIFNSIIRQPSIVTFKKILDITLHQYWDHHFIPGKPSKSRQKNLGQQTIHLIIINAFIPLIFTYAKIKDDASLKEMAIDLYRKLPKEKNVIIENWKKLGVKISSSATSQSLIQLKMQYCNKLKCLNCPIGQDILFK